MRLHAESSLGRLAPVAASLFLLAGACTKKEAPAPAPPAAVAAPAPAPAPPAPKLAALVDVVSDTSAKVVALVQDRKWQAPELAGGDVVKRLAGASYELFPAAGQPAPGTPGRGTLAGGMKEECHEFSFPITGASTGFAVVGSAVHAVPLAETKSEPAQTAAVAALIGRVAKVKVAPTIEKAYKADLDGDGKPEILLQATHPDLTGDPPKYKRQYYSLLVVLPGAGGEPAFTGYLQAAKDLADFEVLTLDSAADVDGDGRPELLVRARHGEGWQTQVFRYTGRLEEVFRQVSGEGQCPGTPE